LRTLEKTSGKMFSLSLAHISFEWELGFEEFLREDRRRIVDPETIAYYRSIFKKHLEGETLSED
jgi:hypothetical protein